MVDPDRFAETRKLRATTHTHMLTGIDKLPRRGIREGTRAPAEAVPRFEDGDRVTARGQRRRGSQTRKTAAEDEDV